MTARRPLLKMKPCPFCGAKPKRFVGLGHHAIGCFSYRCRVNPCASAEMEKNTPERALELWNRRSDADAELSKLRSWKREQQQALIHLSCALMDRGLVKSRNDDCIEVAVKAIRDRKAGDAEAERRGARSVLYWLAGLEMREASVVAKMLAKRLGSGEVLPAKKGRKRT